MHALVATFDDNSNWFAYPSPDNNWTTYIAYMSDKKQANLFGKTVKLRLINLKAEAIKDTKRVFNGGQGTTNAPLWSPEQLKYSFCQLPS